jgi:hypothetical protein
LTRQTMGCLTRARHAGSPLSSTLRARGPYVLRPAPPVLDTAD